MGGGEDIDDIQPLQLDSLFGQVQDDKPMDMEQYAVPLAPMAPHTRGIMYFCFRPFIPVFIAGICRNVLDKMNLG